MAEQINVTIKLKDVRIWLHNCNGPCHNVYTGTKSTIMVFFAYVMFLRPKDVSFLYTESALLWSDAQMISILVPFEVGQLLKLLLTKRASENHSFFLLFDFDFFSSGRRRFVGPAGQNVHPFPSVTHFVTLLFVQVSCFSPASLALLFQLSDLQSCRAR